MKKKPVLIVSGSQKQSSSMTMLQKSLCRMSDYNSIVDKQYKLNMHVQNRRPLGIESCSVELGSCINQLGRDTPAS